MCSIHLRDSKLVSKISFTKEGKNLISILSILFFLHIYYEVDVSSIAQHLFLFIYMYKKIIMQNSSIFMYIRASIDDLFF